MKRPIPSLFLSRLVLSFVVGVFLVASHSLPAGADRTGTAEKLKTLQPRLSVDEQKRLALLEHHIVPGGPPKDGIPSIDKPKYTTAKEADEWLLSNDIVFGVEQNGFVAAYPQRILVFHEIVNERLAGEQVAITYCPLTGTAIGFYGTVASGVATQFGVSGKLVNSNLIMYDRVSDSYWPQVLGRAIRGPAKGMALKEFPVTWTTWERWKRKHPNTRVLSRDTGFFRSYERRYDPYGSYVEPSKGYYADEGQLLFNPIHHDGRLRTKAIVVGVRDANGNALAIDKDALRRRGSIETKIGDRPIVARYDAELDAHRVELKESGERLNAFDAMWFAWVAFYPNTQLVR